MISLDGLGPAARPLACHAEWQNRGAIATLQSKPRQAEGRPG
jgi:hypothetical protein